MKKHKVLSIILALFLASSGFKAQYFTIDPMYYHNFDKDSLAGFDEVSSRASAIQDQFLGSEFKIRMYELKRQFIDVKYHLIKRPPSSFYENVVEYLNANRPAAIPGCVNEDFELSTAAVVTATNQISGWTITQGYNGGISNPPPSSNTLAPYFPTGVPSTANSCNLLGCCPAPPAHSELIDCSAPGGFIDTQIGSQYPIFSVFGSGPANVAASAANPQITNGQFFGSKVLRLNDGVTGDRSIERLSKTFSVSSSNALFQFAFISVFAPGHGCCDAGGFIIRLSNASTNAVLPCPVFSVSAPSSQCTATVPIVYNVALTGAVYTSTTSANTIYNPWKINSLDLTAYIGQNITIDILSSDCNAGGHYGKVYFDAQCGPMTVYGNGNPYDAGSNVTVPTCGASGATICAADGLGPYSWAGPNLPQSYSIPSMTNQCIITNISAQYTLYMSPEGSCAPIQRVVNSTITPAPLLGASVAQAQCGGTLAVVSLTPSGSAANPSSLLWFPTPLSLNQQTTQGTYTLPVGPAPNIVSITASDPLGCKVTTTVNINSAPPIPSFTIVNTTNSNSITCEYPVVNLDAVTSYSYNGGSLNYFWASASLTFSTSSISISNPGNFTVNAVDPVTNCQVTRTVSIGVNIVAPLSTISPSFQSITCGTLAGANATNVIVTASPSVNVTHQILSPYGGTFSASSYSTQYTPGGVGNFTYCLKNDVNGCVTCKEFTVTSNQGFPSFSILSPESFTLGCGTKSIAGVNIVNGNTTPQGGAVSYTILSPGQSSVTPNGPLSGIQTYTVNVPGTYTVITKDNVSLCETRVPISVLSNTFAPDISAVVERQILDCNNPKVVLKGKSITSGVEYSWKFVGPINTLQGDTITAIISPTAIATQTVLNTYTLIVNNLSSTCKSQSVIPIYQNVFAPKPAVTPITSSLTCLTNTVVLTNGSSTGIPPTSIFTRNLPVIGFLWTGPSPQEPLSNATTYTGATVGIYTLTVKDLNNGCTSFTTATIIDNRTYPDFLIKDTVFLDCGAQSVELSYVLTNSTGMGPKQNWSAPGIIGDPTKDKLPVTQPGSYGVVVTYSNGCSKSAEFTVISGSLTAEFAAETFTNYAPATISFKNKSRSSLDSVNVVSTWNFGNGTTKTTSLTTITSSNLYTSPGTYTVTLYATKGQCIASTQKVVKIDIPSVLTIPNVFTPNGDGANDLFFVKAANLSKISAVIFDRWGHVVYELESATGNIEWDGKNMEGKDSAEGVYFYTIKATGKDDKAYDKKGTINLYR
ncbi:gliding motility-associated C-terminal domain-containing protein [Aurantibacillus circumpalustris]|uniref:gliding motility-associated C-terminal domain-containing protein n=1 Tax=Aurantibacillus circumpalustris TaxID=3036359 RepID=UPI00295B026F|nr:gliding motility-associated C-terminal domain-containing protein [Aurantibacillus circumpalustris]